MWWLKKTLLRIRIRILETKIPDEPMFVQEQAEFIMNKVVSRSVHTASPTFIGHMTSAMPYFMMTLAKIMYGLNQNLVKIETSKAFTPMERQVIGMLHRQFYQNNDSFYKSYTQHKRYLFGAWYRVVLLPTYQPSGWQEISF